MARKQLIPLCLAPKILARVQVWANRNPKRRHQIGEVVAWFLAGWADVRIVDVVDRTCCHVTDIAVQHRHLYVIEIRPQYNHGGFSSPRELRACLANEWGTP